MNREFKQEEKELIATRKKFRPLITPKVASPKPKKLITPVSETKKLRTQKSIPRVVQLEQN